MPVTQQRTCRAARCRNKATRTVRNPRTGAYEWRCDHHQKESTA